MTDEWRSYRQLCEMNNWTHLTVNHKFNFLDFQTGSNTQAIEFYWGKVKLQIKQMKGIRESCLKGYGSFFLHPKILENRNFLNAQ